MTARTTLGLCLAAAAGAAAGLVALGGCTTVLGIRTDRYLDVDVDAGPDDAGITGNFACANDPVPSAAAGPLELELFVNDIATVSSSNNFRGKPVPGADVRACGKLDVNCGSPLGTAISDDAGIALLTVPSGFDGYCELTATGFTSSITARTPVLNSEYSLQAIANVALIASGGQLAGVKSDPDLGIAIVSVLDCDLVPSPGMVIEVGAPAANEVLVYLDQTLPSASATQTDATGSAIIYNVPPGTLQLTARFASDRRVLRSMTTLARGQWVTFVQIRLDQTRRSPPT